MVDMGGRGWIWAREVGYGRARLDMGGRGWIWAGEVYLAPEVHIGNER
jgi:hypothetical protein